MARRRRRMRAQARALAWHMRNPEARMWEPAAIVKAALLARGNLAQAQALVINPARLRRYRMTR